MNTVKLFLNNKSQSLRFPKALEFGAEVSEVTVVAVGKSRVIAPVEHTWDAWFAEGPNRDALLPEREQPPMQHRESLK